MAISRFLRIPKSVKEFFDGLTQKVFTLEELDYIFQEHINQWSLPVSTVEDFEKQLVQSDILQANKFEFEERIKSQIRFWTSKADIYDVAISLIPQAHLSHITALFLHGIIEKPPKSIYITSQQSKRNRIQTIQFEQADVDSAFSKPQRQANTKCIYSGKEIIILNGMFTNDIGVIDMSGKPVTSLERTLIDITVRPAYAGGVSTVLMAFIMAKDKIDVDALINILETINYTYPYYQSIGFYLEVAGYQPSHISKLKTREKFIDFYLDYAIENPAYSKEWQIFYPKELNKALRANTNKK